MSSFKITSELKRVIEALKLNIKDAKIKENHLKPDLTSLEFGSVYDDGLFRMQNDDVIRIRVIKDEYGVDVITETIYSIVNDEKISFITTSKKNIEEIKKTASYYDHYVQARELDFKKGVEENEYILKKLKELGVIEIIFKNISLMFSDETYDKKIIL